MKFSSVFLTCVVIGAFVNVVSSNRERKITEILESVRRIEEHISKEDRLREIADIVRIDANVDRLTAKLDRVLSILDSSSTLPEIGRSSSMDLNSGFETIQNRLQNLETSVQGVEESVKKMDPVKMNEIERRTTQLKDDMNTKLRKMMNIMSALYELNKEMKANADTRSETTEDPPSKKTDDDRKTLASTEFFIENLEELERKIKEQFSVLTSQMQYEVTNLKTVAISSRSNCKDNNDDEDLEDEWINPQNGDNARSIKQQNKLQTKDNTLNSLMETLGRSTREIREDIQQGIQDIDVKLQNLTTLAQQSKCDPIRADESIRSARKAILPSVPSGKTERCTTVVRNVPNPKSCADLRKGGATCDGIYVIFPKGRRAVRVLCDMTVDGGGWTVLMRRGNFGDKMTSFHRNWLSYKNGFGDSEGEFWIGNDVMHFMTSEGQNMLRIHMESFDGDSIDLDYTTFSVGNESTSYRLSLGVPLGPQAAAHSLRYHHHHPFSTFDRKNDDFEQNCAATYKGGWWFNGCYFAFLTGEYFGTDDKRENWQGMLWYDWKGNAPLKAAAMMIRPVQEV